MEILLIDSTWPPQNGDYRSKIILNYDNWDDYHYHTSFGMYFCDDHGEVQNIGPLKIYYYDNDEARTNNYSSHTRKLIGNDIEQLGTQYCSLGQELSYYRNLKKHLPNEFPILFLVVQSATPINIPLCLMHRIKEITYISTTISYQKNSFCLFVLIIPNQMI